MNGCTIVARNYIAFARVLARSFLEHHPGSQFTVLVIDDLGASPHNGETFRVMHLEDLGLPMARLNEMALLYNVTELATALKPAFLRRLLRDGADHVVYLDPDIRVFAGFPEVAELARRHGIVLTPHVLEPMPRDPFWPSENQILVSGMFNLGFISVSHAASEFLDWWGERLARDAVIDPCRGLFTDQRWVDFVPVLFDHHVIRNPGFNVGYWNVFQRGLERPQGQYQVSGVPLRFFHFSGFDVKKPHLLSKHQGMRPRTLLSEHPLIAELCRDYTSRLRASGHDESSALPYGFNALPNGWEIDLHMRQLYRQALVDAEDEADEPPNPFDPGGVEGFVKWLQEPDVVDHARTHVSRYLASHWRSRLDLQVAFPSLVGEDAARFRAWAATDESFAQTVPALLRTTRLSRPPHQSRVAGEGRSNDCLVPGVTVAGYFQAHLGVGQAGRLLVAGVEEAGVPFSTVTYDRTLSPQEHPFEQRNTDFAFDVNMLCVNADQTPAFVQDLGRGFTAGRYNVGVWFWEVEHFPPEMHGAFEHVDEVWVASEFVRAAIAAHTSKPVHVVPLPVLVPGRPTRFTRADLGLPEGYLFHFSFDLFSVAERKNPMAAVDAFSTAFEPGEGASLFIKTINGAHNVSVLEELRLAAAHHPDIHVVDRCLPAAHMRALTQLIDCTVSLHRSEGFGLTLAEAMASGKPVIATGYSGNVTFMDEENSFLVPYDLVPVGPGLYPYPSESRWADPDVEAAARLMRKVFDNQEAAAERGRLGLESIRERHDVSRTAQFIVGRLADIRARGNGSRIGAELASAGQP